MGGSEGTRGTEERCLGRDPPKRKSEKGEWGGKAPACAAEAAAGKGEAVNGELQGKSWHRGGPNWGLSHQQTHLTTSALRHLEQKMPGDSENRWEHTCTDQVPAATCQARKVPEGADISLAVVQWARCVILLKVILCYSICAFFFKSLEIAKGNSFPGSEEMIGPGDDLVSSLRNHIQESQSQLGLLGWHCVGSVQLVPIAFGVNSHILAAIARVQVEMEKVKFQKYGIRNIFSR